MLCLCMVTTVHVATINIILFHRKVLRHQPDDGVSIIDTPDLGTDIVQVASVMCA
jgi:hypothetical protein